MKKVFLVVSFLFIFAICLNAQQTTKLQWFHEGATPAQALSFNAVVKVDNVVVKTPYTCVADGANALCTIDIGNLSNGSHTFNVSTLVDNVFRDMSLTKTFPLTGNNAQPSNPRFSITITITSGD